MKKLPAFLLSTALLATLGFAKDKDFGVGIERDTNLQIGKNEMEVSISSKTIPVYNANVKLKLYQKGEVIKTYKVNSVNEDGKYVFNVDFPRSGEYSYLLSFNYMGGVIHRVKGDWRVSPNL